ncbi:MAG: hypothetical protein VB959_13830 [Rhodospirillales bacterium]
MIKFRSVPLTIALGLALAAFMAAPVSADPAPQTTPKPISAPGGPGDAVLPDV